MARIKHLNALILMFFTMALLGGISSTKGIVLEAVRADIGLDLNQFGLVVFIFQWGFTLASLIIGYYTDKRGLKLMTIIGSLIMGIGLFGTGVAPTVAFFLGFYMIVGFGLGAMTVASNAVVPAVYPEKQGMMFNITMGVYGIGMFLTPLILNYMFSHGISWRYFYIGITVLLVLFIIYTASVKVPEGKANRVSIRDFVKMIRNSQFVLVMLFLVFYVSAVVVTLGKYFANEWVYLFAVAGLFFSVLFPTATGVGTKLSETGGSALGLVYVAAGIGGAFAGWIVGAVSDVFGPQTGFNLPIVFLVILFVISLLLKERAEKVRT